jgi:hypothetical protein
MSGHSVLTTGKDKKDHYISYDKLGKISTDFLTYLEEKMFTKVGRM